MKVSQTVTVRQLAERRGKPESSVRRWLHALERTSGKKVVMREGDGARGRMFTTLAALRAADPRLVEDVRADRERIKALEEKCRELTKQLSATQGRLRALAAALPRAS